MSRIAFSLLVILASAHAALAQPGSSGASSRPGGFGLPQVGSALPDVTVFNDDSSEFSTKSLRGHYSVLVFGCLT